MVKFDLHASSTLPTHSRCTDTAFVPAVLFIPVAAVVVGAFVPAVLFIPVAAVVVGAFVPAVLFIPVAAVVVGAADGSICPRISPCWCGVVRIVTYADPLFI